MLIKKELIDSLKQRQVELAKTSSSLKQCEKELADLKPGFLKMEAELQELDLLLNSASRSLAKMQRNNKFVLSLLDRGSMAKAV